MKKPLHIFKLRSHIKLFLLFIATILIPIIVLSCIFMNVYTGITKNNILNSNDRELNNLSTNLNSELNNLVSFGKFLYLNPDLCDFLKDYYDGIRTADDNATINDIISKYKPMTGMISPYVMIVSLDGMIFGDLNYSDCLEVPEMQTLFKSFQKQRNMSDTAWISDSENGAVASPLSKSFIYAARALRDPETWDLIGIAVFQIRESELLKLYMASADERQSIFLLGQSNATISYIDNMDLGENPYCLFGDELEKYSASFIRNFEGSSMLISISTIQSTQWKVVSVSDMDYLLNDYYQTTTIYALAIGFFAMLSLVLSYFLSSNFMIPIKNLSKQMNLVKQGNLKAHAKVYSNDEMGELCLQFNNMVDRINGLLVQVVKEQKLKRNADILSLQSQINPHFIYNTLASIRYMICTNNPEQADRIILSLINILKNVLSDSHALITVNMEIEHLNNYLTIQKFGFESPLKINIDIDADIGNCKTIKLILQPIVENALFHGLKSRKTAPVLNIRGYSVDENTIEFEVSDNGVGFDVAILKETQNSYMSGTRIGVNNVDKRIKLYFGQEYGIKIYSEIGIGTTVKMRIPKIFREEG